LAFEVKYEYIVRQPRIYRGPAFCALASFQTSGNWSVKNVCGTSSHNWRAKGQPRKFSATQTPQVQNPSDF